jgi:hypothetical protein
MQKDGVDIRPLKRFAAEKMARDSTLRRVLSAEPDSMSVREFLAKLETWLVILKEDEE